MTRLPQKFTLCRSTFSDMDRRTALRSVSAAIVSLSLAGCLGEEVSGGFSPDEDGETEDDSEDDGAAELSPEAETVVDQFESRDVEVTAAEEGDEEIVVTIQTSGSIDDDMAAAAGAYATVVESVDRDLRVRVEDRGMFSGSFRIEQEWAANFANDRLSDSEFIEKIDETRSDQ